MRVVQCVTALLILLLLTTIAAVLDRSVDGVHIRMQETMSTTAPWRSALLKSLEANKELKHSTFFQLATIRPNNKPANRTMVYRGFVGDSTKLTFTTDSRHACTAHLLSLYSYDKLV